MNDEAVTLHDQIAARLDSVHERLAKLDADRAALEDARAVLEAERGDLLRRTGILAEVLQRGRAGGLRYEPAKDEPKAPGDPPATTEQGG